MTIDDIAKKNERWCAGVIIYINGSVDKFLLADAHQYEGLEPQKHPSWCNAHYDVFLRYEKAGLTQKKGAKSE